jgi:tRNA (cmo5U34)-methyltransferase
MTGFDDPAAVARYAENPPRMVPGFHDMQRMAGILLGEHVPSDGRVLVLGAGGGLETKVLAATHSGWQFDGVDPSGEMLALARRTLEGFEHRVTLHHGVINDAPDGPFDGALSLLVMHFIPKAERLATLIAIRARLRPGSPFVCAHFSIPGDAAERRAWMHRYVAFAVSSGIPAAQLETAPVVLPERLSILRPDEDEALLQEAGFTAVSLFYTAFTFRGWLALA